MHTPQTPEDRARHWDSAYAAGGSVSWYQKVPHVSVGLIESLGVPHDAPVLDVGGGASTLADQLVARGFADVSVLDVSAAALDEGRRRLGDAAPVHWLHEDILVWQPERRYGLWHDRALLHFLVDSDDRAQYMKSLRSALRDEGFVLLSTFATDGPEVCSGPCDPLFGRRSRTDAWGRVQCHRNTARRARDTSGRHSAFRMGGCPDRPLNVQR